MDGTKGLTAPLVTDPEHMVSTPVRRLVTLIKETVEFFMKVPILRAPEITGKGVVSLWALAGLGMAQDRVGTETLGGRQPWAGLGSLLTWGPGLASPYTTLVCQVLVSLGPCP